MYTSQAGVSLVSCSIERLGIFPHTPLPASWVARPSQGYSLSIRRYSFIDLSGERHCES